MNPRSQTTSRRVAVAASLAAVLACGHFDPSPREHPSSPAPLTTTPAAAPSVTTATVTPETAPIDNRTPGGVVTTAPTTNQERGSLAPSAGAQVEPAPCRALAIGDSLTSPQSHGGGYLLALERQCGCVVDNLGRGGDMTNQMRARLEGHLAHSPHRYRYVIVFGGVNDLYSDLTARRSVSRIRRDLTGMYLAAKAHGARVIAMTVAPWGGFSRYYTPHRAATTLELNRWIESAPGLGLADYAVDAYALLSCGTATHLCPRYAAPFRDGLHFGPQGHRRLGEALVTALGPEACPSAPDAGPAGAGGVGSREDPP